MSGIGRLFTQTVTVQTYQGGGNAGPVRAAPVTRSCFINDSVKLVRNAQGEEVVSSARLYGPITDADVYLPESLVTVNGVDRTVITRALQNAAGPSSAHHIEVHLT